MKGSFNLLSSSHKWGDCSVMYQMGFQDPATTTMEGIYVFNLHLLFVIISIVLFVVWLLFIALKNFTEFSNSKKINFTHLNLIKIVWASVSVIIGTVFSSYIKSILVHHHLYHIVVAGNAVTVTFFVGMYAAIYRIALYDSNISFLQYLVDRFKKRKFNPLEVVIFLSFLCIILNDPTAPLCAGNGEIISVKNIQRTRRVVDVIWDAFGVTRRETVQIQNIEIVQRRVELVDIAGDYSSLQNMALNLDSSFAGESMSFSSHTSITSAEMLSLAQPEITESTDSEGSKSPSSTKK